MKNLVKKCIIPVASLACCLSLSFGIANLNAFAAEVTSADLFTGAFVTLSDGITAKFNYTVPDGYTSATATFTYKGAENEPLTFLVASGTNVLSFDEVQPAAISEKIEVELTLDGDGKNSLVDTAEFTVADYIENLLTAEPSSFAEIKSQEQYVAMRTLAANLVNTSAKTQAYLGWQDTASSLLKTATVRSFVSSSVPSETDLSVGTLDAAAEYGFIGAKLLIGNKVDVAFYFVAKDSADLTAEITLGGDTTSISDFEEASEIEVKDGFKAYRAVYKGLSVVDFDKIMTAKLLKNGSEVGNVVTYSVKSYVYAMQSSGNAQMKALATAVYNYGLSAQTYLEAMDKNYEVELPVTESKANNIVDYPLATQSIARIYGWGNIASMPYGTALANDGEYLYMLAYPASATAVTITDADKTETSAWQQTFQIVKMTFDGKVVGYSASFKGAKRAGDYLYGGLEYYTPLWIKDGYAYSYNESGETIRVSTSSLSGNNVAYEKTTSVAFGSSLATNVNAVVYNAENNKFAVVADGNLSFYSASDLTTSLSSVSESYNRRIGADDDYVYVLTSTDGNYAPTVTVYDWKGKKVTSSKIENSAEVMGATEANTGYAAGDEKKTKPQGITSVGGCLYYQLVGWSNKKVMDKASVYKVEFTEKKAGYSFGEVANEYKNYTLTAADITNGWNGDYGVLSMNSVQKNGWVYSVSKAYGATTATLVRYNCALKSQFAVSKSVGGVEIGTENATLFTYGDKVYLYAVGNKQWLSLPLLFNTDDDWTVETSLPINLGSYSSNFENVYAFEEQNIVVVYVSGKIVVMKDGVVQTSYSVPQEKKNRMGGGTNGYVYYTANNDATLNPVVTLLNVNTGKTTSITLPSVLESAANTAVSGVFEMNGMLCYSMFNWSLGKSCLQAVSLSEVVSYEKPYKELGEAFESIEEGETLTMTEELQIMPTLAGTVKGVVSDGTYYYIANAAQNAEKAWCFRIVKTTKSGIVVGKTDMVKNGSNDQFNDKTYLLYKDGYVYAFGEKFSSVYRVKADEITSDGTCVPEETSDLAFSGVSKISALAYDAVSDRYAVRNGDTLQLVDGKTESVYKTVSGAVAGTQTAVAADENYVYCLYECTGGVAFVVYDWQGNKVYNFSQAGLIKDSNGETHTTANSPSMVIENGKLVIFAKPWQGGYADRVVIITVDINSLKATASA